MRRTNFGILLVHSFLVILSSIASHFGVLWGDIGFAALGVAALFGCIATLAVWGFWVGNERLFVSELALASALVLFVAVFPFGPGLGVFLVHVYLCFGLFVFIFAFDPIYAILVVIPLLLLAGIWDPIVLSIVYSGIIIVVEYYGVSLERIVLGSPRSSSMR